MATIGRILLWVAGIAIGGFALLMLWPLSNGAWYTIAGLAFAMMFNWEYTAWKERGDLRHREIMSRLGRIEQILDPTAQRAKPDHFFD